MNKFLLVTILFCNSLIAQDFKITKVQVKDSFKATIPDSERLNENARFADTLKDNRSQDYEFLDFEIDPKYSTKLLKPAKIKSEKIDRLYKNYVGFSTGYRYGFSSEYSYNSGRSKDFVYSIFFNSLKSRYKINNNQAGKSLTHFNLFVKKIRKNKNSLNMQVNYERKRAISYGHTVLLEESDLTNRFSYFDVNVSYNGDFTFLNSKIQHNSHLFFSDLNELSENNISVNSNFISKFKNIPISLDFEFDNYFNYNSAQKKPYETTEQEHFLNLLPRAQFQKNNFDFDVGLVFDYSSIDGIDLFPVLISSKEIIKKTLSIEFGIENEKKRNTYKSLSDENPFVHSLGTNQNTFYRDTTLNLYTTKFKHIFLKLKTKFSNYDQYISRISYGSVENLHYFENNFRSEYNRFLVHYIDVMQFHFYTSYERKINSFSNLIFDLSYFNWNEKEISHKPNLYFTSSLPINLRNKIICEPIISFIGSQNSFLNQSYTMGSRAYLNLKMTYNYNNRLSSILLLNNILNEKKEIWRGYNDIGFSGAISFNYIF